MRLQQRPLVITAAVAVLLGYLALVAARIDQQALPDFAAFYAVARALAHGGLGAAQHLYSLGFQIRAESIFDLGPARSFVEPFVAPPSAALVVIPFAGLPLWPAFFLWDGLLLGLCLVGTNWLCRQEGLGATALPLALALVASYPTYEAFNEGQYDLLWPLCLALFTAAYAAGPIWRRWLSAAAAAFLFSFKPDLLLLGVVALFASWRQRPVQVAVATLAGLAALSAAALGVSGLLRLPAIEGYTLFSRFPPTLDQTALGFYWRLLGPGGLPEVLADVTLLLALVALSLAWWRNPPRSPVEWKLALTSTVCLSLMVAPHALDHDLVLLIGPAVWTAGALRRSQRSLGPLVAWIVALNVAVVIDASPRAAIPVPLVPILLLAAAVAAWRARRTLAEPLPVAQQRSATLGQPSPLAQG